MATSISAARSCGSLAQAAQAEQHGGDPLLGAVVQVALDAPALGVGDLDEAGAGGAQLGLRLLPVGDVAQVAGEHRAAREARSG